MDIDQKFELNPLTFVQYSEKQTANLTVSMLAKRIKFIRLTEYAHLIIYCYELIFINRFSSSHI